MNKIQSIHLYKSQKKVQTTTFKENDDTKPLIISQYDENTGNLTKKTEYCKDSNNHVKTITTYNPATEAIIETTNYDQNGIIITDNN